ncbi:mycothiol synthase [Spongisporangium articulatum]|uniref:Mycothiol acetyltransferase n=1 Tax=Spongisporangium articulatum TaxID=3362603 RepID=A0ABW8AKS7_9ACTN
MATLAGVTVEAPEFLDDDNRAAARAVQSASAAADGYEPFSEEVTLRWAAAQPADGEHHLVTRDAQGLVTGYGHLAPSGTAEFAVPPEHRRQGYGTSMLAALEELAAEGGNPLRVWSHGDHPGARGLAAAAGLGVVRELLQLGRELDAPPAPADLPAGVILRTFEPGVDDAAWLAVNARAFASHPEQGRMTQADLDARKATDWFDPAGFLVAERDGRMLGFHWTKVPGDGTGEVYVLGVDPDAQGTGLGGALLRAGLHSLYDKGIRTVTLYVEGDNDPALALYRRLEFTRTHADVMYGRNA